MALYFVTVWPSASECTFLNIRLPGPSASRFFKMAAIMTVQGGGCTTVEMQNEIQIHQQKRRKATFIGNNFHDEQA